MSASSSIRSEVPAAPSNFQSFSTRDLPPQEQFDAWRSAHAGSIDLVPTPEVLRSFPADFHSMAMGPILFTRCSLSGAPVRRWRHRPRSFLDHWCLVLTRSVSDENASQSLSVVPSESLSFRSLAMPFEGQASDTEVLTLFIPRDFCREEFSDFERAHGRDIDPATGALLAGFMSQLARHLPHISPQHAEGLAHATRALVAACIAPRVDRTEAAEAPLAAVLIDKARLVVRRNMASPEFGPEQLARLLAMSRSKLYRLFESTGGVAQFINRERLIEAHRRLDAPCDTLFIHVIGTEVGFLDHSTFSRAFRREYGYSPTEARERALARRSSGQDDSSAGLRAGAEAVPSSENWLDARTPSILAALGLAS